MEDLSNNTTHQKSKTKLKLALLIVWIVICTALLIYFLVQDITVLANYAKDLAEWKNPEKAEHYDQDFINTIINGDTENLKYFSIHLIFTILIYTSFMILSIPKLIDDIRSLRVEHREDMPLA